MAALLLALWAALSLFGYGQEAGRARRTGAHVAGHVTSPTLALVAVSIGPARQGLVFVSSVHTAWFLR